MYMYFYIFILVCNKGFTFFAVVLISYYSSVGKSLYLHPVCTVIKVFKYIHSSWIFYFYQKLFVIKVIIRPLSAIVYRPKLTAFISVLYLSSGVIFYFSKFSKIIIGKIKAVSGFIGYGQKPSLGIIRKYYFYFVLSFHTNKLPFFVKKIGKSFYAFILKSVLCFLKAVKVIKNRYYTSFII